MYPANGAVGTQDAEFAIEACTMWTRVKCYNPLAIIRMYRLWPQLRCCIKLVPAASPDFLVGRADVQHPTALQISQIEGVTAVFGNLPKALFAFGQLLLGELASGDVARDCHQAAYLALLVADRHFGSQEPDIASIGQ